MCSKRVHSILFFFNWASGPPETERFRLWQDPLLTFISNISITGRGKFIVQVFSLFFFFYYYLARSVINWCFVLTYSFHPLMSLNLIDCCSGWNCRRWVNLHSLPVIWLSHIDRSFHFYYSNHSTHRGRHSEKTVFSMKQKTNIVFNQFITWQTFGLDCWPNHYFKWYKTS